MIVILWGINVRLNLYVEHYLYKTILTLDSICWQVLQRHSLLVNSSENEVWITGLWSSIRFAFTFVLKINFRRLMLSLFSALFAVLCRLHYSGCFRFADHRGILYANRETNITHITTLNIENRSFLSCSKIIMISALHCL